MMKKLGFPDQKTKHNYREIDFCKQYSHRCLNHFYGFVKKSQKIIGFIYEFMSNGSLNSYVLKNKKKIDELFIMTTINRLFQGIEYLQLNSLIHRDLKPANVLLDHDLIPYISDFETIRQINQQNEEENNEIIMTNGFGSPLYTAPEQDNGESLSLKVDIYSFGLMIYFLIEKKHMRYEKGFSIYSKKAEEKIAQMIYSTKNLQNLFELCIKFSPLERPTINEIKKFIFDEINSFDYLEKYILQDLAQINEWKILSYIFEGIIITQKNSDELDNFYYNIIYFVSYYLTKKVNGEAAFLISLGNLYNKINGENNNYLKAKEYYEMAAIKYNNDESLYNLGYLYENGFGVKQDYFKAIQYYKSAANLNNLPALVGLGNLYFNGIGVEKDYLEAIHYYEICSKLNEPSSINHLGQMYNNGIGFKQDYKKAKEYFERSSQLNCIDALNNLGILYVRGHGVKQDYKKAKEYFEKAAEFNYDHAIVNLGDLYFNGFGVKQDYLKAKELYLLASEFDNSCAIVNLAMLYYKGYGVKKDYSIAKQLLEIAAQLNDSYAIYYIGLLYENGNGVEQNYIKAKEYYELAAKSNNSEALLKLGNFYYYGYCDEKNYSKAKEYYELSSRLHNSHALICLGNLYEKGYFVELDYLRAKYLYELSSQLNNSEAYLKLGNLFMNGLGVTKDFKTAKKYFEISSNFNNSNAFLMLGKLYKHGLGVKQNYIKAKKYYELASKLNNQIALVKLGNLYKKGKGFEQNYLKAKKYYELASELNDSYAFFNLGYLYSNDNYFDVDIEQSIYYYLKCNEIHYDKIKTYNNYNNSTSIYVRYNKYYYRSSNDLGLIFITYFEDVEKANEYIKIAGLNEYPYGQNNFGLMCQFYLNNINNAEYMYERSSKHNFALAEYNLGYLKENQGKIKESIKLFKKASEHENEILMFHNHKHYDKRLEISKIFIICYTNLKLVDNYFSKNKFIKAKKYFIRSFNKIIDNSKNAFNFEFKNNNTEPFSYLRSFILGCPLFNLINQINFELNLNLSEKIENIVDQIDEESKINKKDKNNSVLDKINYIKNTLFMKIKEKSNNNKQIFNDIESLFEFVIKKESIKQLFIDEIKNIIKIMNKILYTPPYIILFGRIKIKEEKQKINEKKKISQKNVDANFYEGFGF